MSTASELRRLQVLQVPLERDGFLRSLVRHLSGALEDVVGLREATGFISIVGQHVGDEINESYRQALGAREPLSREQVAAVLVDLKRRIQGGFHILEEREDRLVFGNALCPFGDKVLDRPALCMMTSNVFGRIVSENLGYAKVAIEKSIAAGDGECHVTVYLQADGAGQHAEGREYVRQ